VNISIHAISLIQSWVKRVTAGFNIATALAGRGLTLVLSDIIVPEVRSGRLKIVLADYENASLPVHNVDNA
jgi:hypothetical protein